MKEAQQYVFDAVREGEMLQNTDPSKKKCELVGFLLSRTKPSFKRRGGLKMKKIENCCRVFQQLTDGQKNILNDTHTQKSKEFFWHGMKKLLRHLTRFAPSLAPAFSLAVPRSSALNFFFSWFLENRGSLHFLNFFFFRCCLCFLVALLPLLEVLSSS